MQKAKSRLDPEKKRRLAERSSRPARKPAGSAEAFDWQAKIISYLRFLPLLVLSLILYAIIIWLMKSAPPSEIANILLPNFYLPFMVPLFFANLFFFSFLFLNTRRGLLLSLVIQIIVFLRLQQVIFEWSWLLPLTLSAAGFELIISYIQYKRHHPV